MTSEVVKLLLSEKSVRFFDIDGTLCMYEYGSRNHNACREDYWFHFVKDNPNFYREQKPIRVMQDFLRVAGDPKRDFVISCTCDDFELKVKSQFVTDNYPIPAENIFRSERRVDKLDVIHHILEERKLTPIPPENVIIIDDTTDVLSHVQENSDFTTIHISSFLDEEFAAALSMLASDFDILDKLKGE